MSNFKKSIIRSNIALAIILGALLAPVTVWACDSAGPSTHIGKVTALDAKKMTFTILDAQTRDAITFVATDLAIINGLKGVNGMITVNYEEDGDDLTAVGVTF